MLPQQLHWLLPALIVFWTNPLQFGTALPAHDERGSHVSTNIFDPSVATSTMIRQDYNKRVRPANGKNNTQSGHKLVASPAGLLRPDKFQFYTYNDKGDMITRQMTVQEIQGLIAAGSTDHVAMDRQEPHKADDVLTGGKKVMDVVQKVQNVLKSALDKPPTLAGSLPSGLIPEHANVEWSNILPSILSGEADAISSSGESHQSPHKPTTEKAEVVKYKPSIENALNIGTNQVGSNDPKKKPSTQSDVQINAYAGFANNMEHSEKPQHAHHSQQKPAINVFTEKPMIPVPVITLTEQQLSTLQSVVTESPVFQIVSVIPVEAAESIQNKEEQTANPVTTGLPAQTVSPLDQTEKIAELTPSTVLKDSTQSAQPASLNAHQVNVTKQTISTRPGDEVAQEQLGTSATTPGLAYSTVGLQQAATYGSGETTKSTGEISSSSPSYALIRNSTIASVGFSSFAPVVTKAPETSGTLKDKVIPQITGTIISEPLSHAPVSSKPEKTSNDATTPASALSSVSKIALSTVPNAADNFDGGSTPTVTEKLPIKPITPAYTKKHSQPSTLIEPLPTQLIDSFSSVMNQISEARPSVLSISSTSDGVPQMSIVNVLYDQLRNASDLPAASTIASTNEKNIEPVVSPQIHATVTTPKSPLQTLTTRFISYSTAQPSFAATNGESIANAGLDNVSVKPAALTTTANKGVTTSYLPVTSSKPYAQSTDTTISKLSSSTSTSSPLWVQLDKVHSSTEKAAIPEIATTTDASLKKQTTSGIVSLEGFSVIPIIHDVETQSTSASIDTGESWSKSTTPSDKYLDNTLVKLNWSNPVSSIDQMLNTASFPSSTPSIEPIRLPNDPLNFIASDFASGLIAGFATSTEKSSVGGTSGDRIADRKNVSSTMKPSVLPARVKPENNVTQTHEQTTKISVSDDHQKKKNITRTQASTQKPFLAENPAKNATLELNAQKKSNGTCLVGKPNCVSGAVASGEKKGPIKSSSNERIDNSTKASYSSASSPNKFANVSAEPKDEIEQSTIAVGIVTVRPVQLSTISAQASNVDKILPDTGYNKNKKGEKAKTTTQAPVVRTDASLSRLPVKVPLIDSANKNDIRNANVSAESGPKAEASSHKNSSFANLSSTQKAQAQNPLGTGSGFNDSVPALHVGSNKRQSNVTDAGALNITPNTAIPSSANSTNSALSQNRVNNATSVIGKNKDSNNTKVAYTPIDNRTAVTFQTSAQNNKNSHNINSSFSSSSSSSKSPPSSSSSSLSTQKNTNTNGPITKVAQKLSDNVSDKKNHQSNLINGTYDSNVANDTQIQNNKNVSSHYAAPINASISGISNAKNTSVQAGGQSNNNNNSTDSKPASVKHSENASKPEIIRLQLSSQPSNVPLRPSAPKPTASQIKSSEKPEISKPEISKPEISKPEISKPEISKPEISKLEISKPEVSKPEISKPDAAVKDAEDKWTLISQQTPPTMTKLPKLPPRPSKPSRKPVGHTQTSSSNTDENANIRSPGAATATHPQDDAPAHAQSVLPLDASQSVSGLDVSVRHTSADIVNFAKLCNELAFNFWVATNKGLSTARSLALSPFGMTSLLAMIFLGARGPTSDQMNEVLGLDDVATFNPHLVFQNITDTVSLARGQGIANAAFVRELFADKMKVRKLMPFYKEQAQQFYEGLVTEVNFATISDLVRRRTNLLIRKQTGGRIKDFVKTNTVPLRSPLAALSANVFQTDCNTTLTSSVGRDGELYFAVSPAVRQRRLVPVPATTWRSGVLAGYEPSIDATAVALGGSDKLVSTIFVLPGQQGHTAPGDTLDRLEQRFIKSAFRDGAWNKLLKVLIPRNGLELQVPKFSHRSVVNATAALKRMGLDELFSGNADFKGINGVGHRLHLADVLQMNLFSTCGDENILGGRHHVETYPASPLRSIRRRAEDPDFGNVAEDDVPRRRNGVPSREDRVSSLRKDPSYTNRFRREKRQLSTTSEKPRLKLDRPFLYFVRHNPSDIILHMGRFNPRLLP